MLSAFEKAIINRLHVWCGEPPCEKYLKPDELKVVEYNDRFEIFCAKHGSGKESSEIGSNCLLIVQRFPMQSTLANFKVLSRKKQN
jgi:hypothetical protein